MHPRGLRAPGLDFNQGHPATASPESNTHIHAQVFLISHTHTHTRFCAIQLTGKTSRGSKFRTAVELQVSTFTEQHCLY